MYFSEMMSTSGWSMVSTVARCFTKCKGYSGEPPEVSTGWHYSRLMPTVTSPVHVAHAIWHNQDTPHSSPPAQGGQEFSPTRCRSGAPPATPPSRDLAPEPAATLAAVPVVLRRIGRAQEAFFFGDFFLAALAAAFRSGFLMGFLGRSGGAGLAASAAAVAATALTRP